MASAKLVNAMQFLPVLFSLAASLYYFYLSPYLADNQIARLMHTGMFFLFCPIYAYICILARDRVAENIHILKSRFYCFFYTEHVITIQGMRNNLKKQIREIVNVKGPEIFNDFEEIKQRQLQKLYQETRSNYSNVEALEIEIGEALDELKEMGY